MTRGTIDHQAGFTLVEVLVVLAITAIVFGMGAIGLSVLKGRVSPDRSAAELAALLNTTHDQALTQGRLRSVTIDLRSKIISNDAGALPIEIPSEFKLVVTLGQETVTNEERLQILFLPDSTSSGAKINITDKKGTVARLQTNWLTGLTSHVRDER